MASTVDFEELAAAINGASSSACGRPLHLSTQFRLDMRPQKLRHGRQRRYRRGAGLYAIRDVFAGKRFIRCEYAQRNPNGSTKWLPCVEGVEFSAIQPLRVRAHG